MPEMTRLGEVLKVHHGWAFPSSGCRPPGATGGHRLIRIGDFARSRQSTFEPRGVQIYVGEFPFRFRLQPGDLLIAMTCQTADGSILGYPMRVPDNGVQYLHNQRIGRIEITHPQDLDLDFTEYLFRWEELNRYLVSTASGSKILHTAPERIEKFQIRLPTVAEQRRIAGVLGALDDLIDTNRKIADDCTALWRALVRDTLEVAPDSVPLTELARFVNGKNFTKDAAGHGRPVIRTPEVRRGPEPGTVRSDAEPAAEFVAREGDILFVWSGSLTVGRWLWEDGLVNQHVFKVLPKPGVPDWLVYATIEYQMPWFLSLAADKATTMGHIKREHLDAAVPIPSAAEIKRLGEIIEPLWNAALQCGVEIQELTRTRDELLPLLLSGRARVDEVAA